MRKLFLILFIFFISISVFSQKDSVVNYLNSYYKKVAIEQATYIQTIVKKDSLWFATLYYGNGKRKFQGYFTDKRIKNKIGINKSFDDHGNLKSIQNYNLKGKKDGGYSYFNSKGAIITKGFFLNGKKDGVWNYLDDNLTKRARIVFKKGKVLDYKLWNEKGVILNEKLILFQKPKIKGGLKLFNVKMKRELINDLRKEGLKTNFLLKCVIDETGNIKNITISPEINSKFKEKIIKYFKTLENVSPAILANRKVTYPIEMPFILN